MLTLREMAEWLGNDARNHIPAERLDAVAGFFCQDSRKAVPGSVFVCIKGEKSDGHDFAGQVAEQGVLAVIAERDPFPGQTPPVAVLRVDDSVVALNTLAARYRDRTKAIVVGVTGTAGKTSVKEVLSCVLGVKGPTAKNHMNMNTQIGLPISLLNAPEDAAFWVMEAGISEARDMDDLAGVLRPDLAVILNVGPGHLSGLGDKGVAYYKSRMLHYLAPGGRALVSADYPSLVQEAKAHGKDLKFFSTNRCDMEFFASYVGPASAATGRYEVRLEGQRYEMVAPFRGEFGSENVAAIAGAAYLLGLTPEEISMGLVGAALPAQRFSCTVKGCYTFIDDSYNSNPLSAARMLDSASEMAAEKKVPLILVMGEMLELGDGTAEAHKKLGKRMAASGASRVYWKGGQANAVESGLRQEGYAGPFVAVGSAQAFKEHLCELPLSGGVVLLKGSRGNRMEELGKVLKTDFLDMLAG